MRLPVRVRAFNVPVLILLVLAGVAFLAPFAWMVSTSLKPLNETMTLPAHWIPSTIQWHNYPDAIRAMGPFWRYTGNSLFLCVMTVVGTVTSSALAAYGFSRIEWKGRDQVFLVLLATMMIPYPIIMVPIFSLFKSLGWIGTFRPLWTPSFLAGAFNVFLLKQFFISLPKDMTEAARIDGCSEFQILTRIILPLSKPALLVVAIFSVHGDMERFPRAADFPDGAKGFHPGAGSPEFPESDGRHGLAPVMAASVLVTLPVIIIFFLAQRTFIEGVAATGGK